MRLLLESALRLHGEFGGHVCGFVVVEVAKVEVGGLVVEENVGRGLSVGIFWRDCLWVS